MSGLLPDGIASPHRGFANQTPIQYDTPQNVDSAYSNLNPSAGSADLIEPRQARGIAGHQKLLVIDGAVTGRDSEWTGLKTNAPARKVGAKGVVTGGADYISQAQIAFGASQMQMLTEQASSNALFASV